MLHGHLWGGACTAQASLVHTTSRESVFRPSLAHEDLADLKSKSVKKPKPFLL